MKSRQLSIPLSQLVTGSNPRKVKPSQQSHEQLVALIRAYGLIQPLVVQPLDGKTGKYEIVAGEQRLRALRAIHKGKADPQIPCILPDVDAANVENVSLAENFGREPMHPLDEAEAFAKLASEDSKGVDTIAADFGVTAKYVRQRMSLANLANEVKKAYRANEINTGTAEAFASIPRDRQMQIWKELNGQPRNAEQVRHVIANGWIEAGHALFDVSALPDSVVSRDLFAEQILIERQAFMDAQIQALASERTKFIEEGWRDAITGRYEDIHDQPLSMDHAEREYDKATMIKLEKLAEKRQKIQVKYAETDDDRTKDALRLRFEDIEDDFHDLEKNTPVVFSEETKAVATVFLILHANGQVQRDYRVARRRSQNARSDGNESDVPGKPEVPTSEDLSDPQLAVGFTHEAMAVREALLKNASVRNRVLAMILHEKVHSDGLAIRHEPNATTIQAGKEGFVSAVQDRLRKERAKFDPFIDGTSVEDCQGYERLGELSTSKLESLIDLLVVECITADLRERTELVHHLAAELKVNVRDHWRPDAAWLSGFQKIQLSHLIGELLGPVHIPAPERKKSELVEMLAKLFTDAAEKKLDDAHLIERVNRWLPMNLRHADAK